MARREKGRGIYSRGGYWLDRDLRADGTERSPFYVIYWYDDAKRRVRTASTRTDDVVAARQALDRHYLNHAEGENICAGCGQRKLVTTDLPLLRAITDYLASHEELTSINAVRPRLNHVVSHVAHLNRPDLQCSKVDEKWIEDFRKWLLARPVVTSSGRHRAQPRSPSSVENSVIQLAAAINAAHKRGDAARPAQFKPIPTKELNRTPQRRLFVAELADAFRYATDPAHPVKRLGLHRFLMISVGTGARPDAAHDFSTAPDRRQWNADRRILALNPAGRRQTRKRRAVVIAPRQLAPLISEIDGFFVPAASVKSAWETMVEKLGWPADGEGGMKLIRRSVAQLLRDAGTPRGWNVKWRKPTRKVPKEQIEALLGHRVFDSVTDLYAAFDADYLSAATAALEGIIEEIERLCPRAFAQGPMCAGSGAGRSS
jgi:hypothetical protein